MRLAIAVLLVASAGARSSPASAATLVEVALTQLDRMEQPLEGKELTEQQALASTAIRLAGDELQAPLAGRIGVGGTRCVIAAWALSEAASEGAAAARGVEALRRAARDPSVDWECRLGAVSALGRLAVRAAAADVAAVWRDPFRPPGTDGVTLIALAGCGGPEADEVIAAFLRRGGDEAWGRLALAACLRRGPESGALLTPAACDDPDPRVRATAALTLLLLAEPSTACALAECAASERDGGIRRLKYQALAATQSPTALGFLRHASTLERDPGLAAAAYALAELPLSARGGGSSRLSSRDVREALEALVRENPSPRVLDDIETAAAGVDLPAIERALRLLPLRTDARWADDQARLAQLRARLLCAADPDCEPLRPKIGRVSPPPTAPQPSR